ncbi:hypothetical protein CPLU01_04119 [Colletotrichum plurivorum]|uniref:Uncharacterized protein n=1 Tax=Colletotrichum plurivorum TaxID=2175906 RepID=A0A8H6KQ57_9PEZI|nr:hypothetical protein CPLU01_04119 [Colletotrichum plurivorum]
MLHSAGATRRLLVLSLAIARGVLGQSCNGFNITSDESAEAARRCPDINGDVMIFPDNVTEVSLDGVENINGSLIMYIGCDTRTNENCIQRHWLQSVSSATLKTVNGSIDIGQNDNISTISFPKLTSVERGVRLELDYLEHLDITSLETVGTLNLRAPRLATMEHEHLRNATGGFISIGATSLESVDSFIRSPMDLIRLKIDNSLKLKQITLGISSALEVYIAGKFGWHSDSGEIIEDGESDIAKLILGGPETTEMRITTLTILNSTAAIERAPGLMTLEVGTLRLEGNYFMEHLALPFDKLKAAYLKGAPALKWLSNIPQAVDWDSFYSLSIKDMPALNLSSEYMIDGKGDLVRSWYWPRSGMGEIDLSASMTNHFL